MTKITIKQKEDFTKNLSLEIGHMLANNYSQDLFKACNNDLNKALIIYNQMGKLWAPMLSHFAKWIKDNAMYEPFLIMRDAKPLTVLPETKDLNQLFLNRENCGISDELSNTEAKEISPMMLEYVNQWGLAR
jgi:hypothetical protein